MEISIVLNLHTEGSTCIPTFNSILRNSEILKKNNITHEVLIIVDKGDAETKDVARALRKRNKIVSKLILTEFGDLGLARNKGTETSLGKYMNFVDGDDILEDSWLITAYNYYHESKRDNIILHPQAYICFGDLGYAWQQHNITSREGNPIFMVGKNIWGSMSFSRRKIFTKVQYEATGSIGRGFAYEDWAWNCRTINLSYEHFIVPSTIFFYQKRFSNKSLSYQGNSSSSIIPKNNFFIPSNFIKIINKYRGLEISYPSISNNESIFSEILKSKEINSKWQNTTKYYKNIFSPNSIGVYKEDINRNFILGVTYFNICKMIKDNYDIAIIVPDLKIGGTTLVTMNYIESLIKINSKLQILLICTANGSQSDVINETMHNIDIINLQDILIDTPMDDQLYLLSKLIINTGPKSVHVLHSHIGFKLLEKYSKQLSFYAKIFATSFTIEKLSDGNYYSYSFILPKIYNDITAYMSDNNTHLEDLSSNYGIPKKILRCMYQPVKNIKNVNKFKYTSDRLDILWAGRLDSQKNPEIIIKIYDELIRRGINFAINIAGDYVLDKDNGFIEKIKGNKNINYLGGFRSFYDIKFQGSVYLLTSEYEGLPNTILEAMSVGLPIVASNVGGVKEVVDDQNGRLIKDFNNASEYVDAILEIHSNENLSRKMSEISLKKISYKHSEESFMRELKKLDGYIPQ